MTMPATATGTDQSLWRQAYEIVTAISMTVGRGPAARVVADVAHLSAKARVVDIGCGPGTAARLAARQGAAVIAVDPSPTMLRLARWISSARRAHGLDWRQGRAEALPLADAAATVAWALSTVHHWDDPAAGIAEIHRVLAPGGRVMLAERLVKPGARGHAAHGLAPAQAEALADQMRAAGLTDLQTETRRAGRRTLIVLRASRPT
jgi:ubiquinone/menaquinone biosynthesis C-methylase UbiE